MLALDRVGKIYPNGVNALARFSAEIAPGEIVAIIGGSGCGKSTLLRAIAGLDRATSGTVTLDDTAITAVIAIDEVVRFDAASTITCVKAPDSLWLNAFVKLSTRASLNLINYCAINERDAPSRC